jgi:hypothetical protein
MTWRSITALAAGLLLLGACAGGSGRTSGEDGSAIDAAPDSGVAGGLTITGTGAVHYFDDEGDKSEPLDFSRDSLVAFVENGSSGFVEIAGSGKDDGRFAISAVPEGRYALVWRTRVGQLFVFESAAQQLDVTRFEFGRNATAFPLRLTPIFFDATGLFPWSSRSRLSLVSTNAGVVVNRLNRLATSGTPMNGDVALRGMAIDYRDTNSPLLDSRAGDRVVLIQYGVRTSTGVACTRIERIGAIAPFTLEEGRSSTLTAALASLPQGSERTLRVEWSLPSYLRHASEVHPRAGAGVGNLEIDALPGASLSTIRGVGAQLLACTPTVASALSIETGYGDPFAPPMDAILTADVNFPVDYLAEGASMPATLRSGLGIARRVSSLRDRQVLEPVITPVRRIRVNGSDATRPQKGITSTPVITWEPPEIGQARGYRVRILQVESIDGRTSIRLIGFVLSAAARVVIPPGILVQGLGYIFHVSAEDSDNLEIERRPITVHVPTSNADAFTEIMQP